MRPADGKEKNEFPDAAFESSLCTPEVRNQRGQGDAGEIPDAGGDLFYVPELGNGSRVDESADLDFSQTAGSQPFDQTHLIFRFHLGGKILESVPRPDLNDGNA